MLLSGLVEFYKLDHVGGINPAQWPIGVTRNNNLAICPHDELRWLNNITPVFPPRTKLIGYLAGNAVANTERQLRRNFTSFVNRIDAGSHDFGAESIKFLFNFLEADQLPAAVWSPMAAIEKDDAIFRVDAVGKAQRAAVDQTECDRGEWSTNAKFFCHCNYLIR